MKRREFITSVAAAVVWPLAADAQQAMPVVGYLSSGSASGFASRLAAFRQGLADAGFHEGQNIAIEYRWADGQDQRLATMAADLVQRRVSVIAAPGGLAAARAAKSATTTIPVVFETGANPVQAGLVVSLSRPEGNVTGVTSLNVEVGPKRLDLLHELVPAVNVIGALVNPANPNSVAALKELEPVASKLGLQLHAVPASKDQDLEAAFATLAERGAGALVVTPDPFFISRSKQIAALTLGNAVPAAFHTREFVAFGGLIGYGGSVAESHRQAGLYTARILKGDQPANLPIVQVTKVEMIINTRTAKALGITVPVPLLGRADEVIE
jgi:putative ABC transport system substrate-binding protein